MRPMERAVALPEFPHALPPAFRRQDWVTRPTLALSGEENAVTMVAEMGQD